MSRKASRLMLGRINRRAAILRSASRVKIEALERRILFALVNPVVTVSLPEAPLPLQGIVGTPLSQSPAFINTAYGFNSIAFRSNGALIQGNGAGETIAILEAFSAPTIVNDLKTFDAHWGISDNDAENNFALTIQPLGGPGATPGPVVANPDWAEQTSETVEWAHAVAPGAHILLVQSPTANFGDLMDAAVFAAAQRGVVTVAMPWGAPETDFSVGSVPQDTLYDGFMVTPNGHLDSNYNGGNNAIDNSSLHGGVTFLSAAGDTSGTLLYPSTSFEVLPVGGLTLFTDVNGNLIDLGPWANAGGGQTANYTVPIAHTPLVSYGANPQSGVWVYDSTANSNGVVGWHVLGGTAFSTVAFAGMMAIVDQGLALKHIGSMDSLTAINDIQFLGETTPNDFDTLFGGTLPTYPLYTDPPAANAPIPDPAQVPDHNDSGFGPANPILGVPSGQPTAVLLGQSLDLGGYGSGLVPDLVDVLGPYTAFNRNGDFLPIPPPAMPIPPTQTVFPVIQSDAGIGPVVTTAGNVDNISFATQPANATAGQTLAPITIDVNTNTNDGPVLDTSFTGDITLEISSLSPSGTATVLGTTTVTSSGGVATFSNIHIDTAGTFELQATATNAFSALSSQFIISAAAASQLTITSQPGNSWQFSALTPPLAIAVEDQFGNAVSLSNTNVTISVASGPSSVLDGNTTLSLSNGGVTFSNLTIPTPGTYTLLADAGNFGQVTTTAFQVVLIPVTEGFGFNGLKLSKPIILLQQLRNAPDIAASGAPDVIDAIPSAAPASPAQTFFAAPASSVSPTAFSSTQISDTSLASDNLSTTDNKDAINQVLTGN